MIIKFRLICWYSSSFFQRTTANRRNYVYIPESVLNVSAYLAGEGTVSYKFVTVVFT